MVNVNYRLGPENKAPFGILDGYGATKWVLSNSAALKVFNHRVAIMGDCGGGYIVAGVASELAKQGEGDLIKF